MARRLVISASQLKSFASCERKWGFQKVLKVPEPPRDRDPRVFGDVLHACLERYLRADDLGIDPETGEEVDLFPPGWEQMQSKFGPTPDDAPSVDRDQALQIQQLVLKGIGERVVRRLPGRKVEKRIRLQVLDPDPENDLPGVDLMGFVDVWYRDRIEDHKTSSSTRWLLGPKKLAKDPQMLIYAMSCLEDARRSGGAVPSAVILRHNQFVKDDERTVRSRSIEVSRREIEDHWTSWVIPYAERMRRQILKTEWHEFSDPEDFRTCNDYGGCPYSSVCFGKETIDTYRSRIVKLQNRRQRKIQTSSTPSTAPTEKKETDTVSSVREALARRRAQKAGNGAAPAPTAPEPRKREVEEPPKPKERNPAPQGERYAAPWHFDGCASCKDNPVLGFNSQAKPCRVCLIRTRGSGVKAEHYDIDLRDGALVLLHKESDQIIEFPWLPAVPEPKAAPAPEPKAAPAPEPKAAPVIPQPKPKKRKAKKQAAASTPEPEPSAPVAECGHFALFINCVPTKGPRPKIVTLAELMQRHGAELAQAADKDSYYALDAFRRRDALCAMVGTMGLGSCTVIAHPNTPDEKALVSALEAAAGLVVRGTL